MIGEFAQQAFDEQHLAILGTLRKDGWPRISPCEVYFVDDEMHARDDAQVGRSTTCGATRASRSLTARRTASRELGDVKLYGRGTRDLRPGQRERFRGRAGGPDRLASARFERTVFAVDIESASYISFGDGPPALRWTPERGERTLRHPETDAASQPDSRRGRDTRRNFEDVVAPRPAGPGTARAAQL